MADARGCSPCVVRPAARPRPSSLYRRSEDPALAGRSSSPGLDGRLPDLGRRRRHRARGRSARAARSPSPSRSSSAPSAACSASARAWSTSPSTASCSSAPSPPRSSASLTGSAWAACSPPWSPACSSRACSACSRSRYFVDQVIVGVVLNVLVIGLTSFLFTQVLAPNAADPQHAAAVPAAADPGARRHPDHRPGPVPADRRSSTSSTSRSRWSPRRSSAPGGACACAPSASTPRPPTRSGIKVNRTRFRTILLAGADRRHGRRVLHAGLGAASSTGR